MTLQLHVLINKIKRGGSFLYHIVLVFQTSVVDIENQSCQNRGNFMLIYEPGQCWFNKKEIIPAIKSVTVNIL